MAVSERSSENVGRPWADAAYRVYDGWPYVFGRPLFGGSMDTLVSVLGELREVPGVHLVVTPNVDQLLIAEHDAAARDAIRQADLLLADGAPVVMLSRVLGGERPERITGADLLPELARESARKGFRIALLGGRPGVGERAIGRLQQTYPGADMCAVSLPELADDTDGSGTTAAIEELRAAEPDYVFVCLGFPRQETWVVSHEETLPHAVYVGAGAAVDFAAGDIRRAPRTMQKAGLEWLWRLAHEPRRLAHRYLIRGPRFIQVAFRAGAALHAAPRRAT